MIARLIAQGDAEQTDLDGQRSYLHGHSGVSRREFTSRKAPSCGYGRAALILDRVLPAGPAHMLTASTKSSHVIGLTYIHTRRHSKSRAGIVNAHADVAEDEIERLMRQRGFKTLFAVNQEDVAGQAPFLQLVTNHVGIPRAILQMEHAKDGHI